MRTILSLAIILGFTTSLTFCSSGSEKVEEQSQREAPVMYKPSELAKLMHEIHELSDKWKVELENGEELSPVPEWIQNILTAEATSPEELASGPFEAMAQEYIRNLEKLISAEEDGRIDAFNNSISTCISCHKVYCNGPIPKIQKLRI
jgi:phosphoserine aminotransferase